jgi:hypothetical protein
LLANGNREVCWQTASPSTSNTDVSSTNGSTPQHTATESTESSCEIPSNGSGCGSGSADSRSRSNSLTRPINEPQRPSTLSQKPNTKIIKTTAPNGQTATTTFTSANSNLKLNGQPLIYKTDSSLSSSSSPDDGSNNNYIRPSPINNKINGFPNQQPIAMKTIHKSVAPKPGPELINSTIARTLERRHVKNSEC